MAEFTSDGPRDLTTQDMATLKHYIRRVRLAQHLVVVRGYARRVILHGETLKPDEELDKARRIRECMELGSSFKLSEKEVISLLYKEVFGQARKCNCPTCQAQQSSGQA